MIIMMIKTALIALLIGVGLPALGLMLISIKQLDSAGCLLPFILVAVFTFIVLIILI